MAATLRSTLALAAVGCFCSLTACGGSDDDPKDLRLIAPTLLKPALEPLERSYEAANLEFRFTSEDEIAQRLSSGADADVVIAASDVLPSSDAYEGEFVRVSPVGYDRLVAVARPGPRARVGSGGRLVVPGVKIAIGDPASALGRFSLSGIAGLGERESAALESNVVQREGRADDVVQAVRSGTVDAGLVLASDFQRAGEGLERFDLPDELAQPRQWHVGAVAKRPRSAEARRFAASLFDGDAARTLRDAGLAQANGQPAPTIPAR